MYCDVLPLDESDYAFFDAVMKRYKHMDFKPRYRKVLAREATHISAKREEAQRALYEVRAALRKNHKHESHPLRVALRERETSCLTRLRSVDE